eukprot:5140126-Amphidinium_carterae.2
MGIIVSQSIRLLHAILGQSKLHKRLVTCQSWSQQGTNRVMGGRNDKSCGGSHSPICDVISFLKLLHAGFCEG